MTEKERLLVQRIIASIIDHPSVYMGGASQNSMRKAQRIIEALEQAKRLFPTACDHSGWKNFELHGDYCPDCMTILPEHLKPTATVSPSLREYQE